MGKHVHLHFVDAAPAPVRAAGVMCIDPDGRMLFLKRGDDAPDHAGTWCFPGGKIEAGEHARAAARREMLEETGGSIPVPLGEPVDRRDGFVTYPARLPAPFDVRLNGEHSGSVWAKPEDAPEPLHPGVAATLALLSGKVG